MTLHAWIHKYVVPFYLIMASLCGGIASCFGLGLFGERVAHLSILFTIGTCFFTFFAILVRFYKAPESAWVEEVRAGLKLPPETTLQLVPSTPRVRVENSTRIVEQDAPMLRINGELPTRRLSENGYFIDTYQGQSGEFQIEMRNPKP